MWCQGWLILLFALEVSYNDIATNITGNKDDDNEHDESCVLTYKKYRILKPGDISY